jgi:hypothetical protein
MATTMPGDRFNDFCQLESCIDPAAHGFGHLALENGRPCDAPDVELALRLQRVSLFDKKARVPRLALGPSRPSIKCAIAADGGMYRLALKKPLNAIAPFVLLAKIRLFCP